MGDIADSMLEGEICSWCGLELDTPMGVPALCHACWADASKQDREGFMRAKEFEGEP